MSDAWGLEDDFADESADEQLGGPKPLRDAYKAQKEKNKALEDRLAQLEQKLNANSVESTFKTLGVDPTLVSEYKGDASPEAVKAWVDNMRNAFGGAPSTPQTAEPVKQPELSADARAQYQRLSEAGSDSAALGAADAAMASIKSATSVADLLNAWKGIS